MKKITLKKALAYLVIIIGAIISLFPFFWMIATAVKKLPEVFAFPPIIWPTEPQWDNFYKVMTTVPFFRYFFNTLYIGIMVTMGQVIICSMAAYAFARLKFPGRDKLFFLYLGTMMIPGQVTMIPAFILMKWFGWINTHYALIIPGLAAPFGTFLLRQFFLSIPYELEEAAILDGASRFGIYSKIILPLSKPALATLGVFTFLANWNSFIWPLVTINSDRLKPLPVGLASLQSLYLTNWPILMAGAVLSLVPIIILFMFTQKYFVEAITLTGIKG